MTYNKPNQFNKGKPLITGVRWGNCHVLRVGFMYISPLFYPIHYQYIAIHFNICLTIL